MTYNPSSKARGALFHAGQVLVIRVRQHQNHWKQNSAGECRLLAALQSPVHEQLFADFPDFPQRSSTWFALYVPHHWLLTSRLIEATSAEHEKGILNSRRNITRGHSWSLDMIIKASFDRRMHHSGAL